MVEAEAVRVMPIRNIFFQQMDQKGVETEFERYQEKPEVTGIVASKSDFAKIGKSIKICVYIMMVIGAVLTNFILTLILILMFSGLQALWKSPGLETLKFGRTFSLLCYAAFPALTIRMILESFGFNGIAEILFYIIFFIYQMIAFHEVRRSISGDGNRNGSED